MSDTVAQRLLKVTEQFPGNTAVLSKDAGGDFQPTTFAELFSELATIAAGLAASGVERGAHVGLISDSRKEWLLADLSLLGLGAVDVPRGSDSTDAELRYIIGHADCRASFVEDPVQLTKLLGVAADLPELRTAIVLDAGDEAALAEARQRAQSAGVQVLTLAELRAAGGHHEQPEQWFRDEIAKGGSDDLATIIYTSGTTGEPKGVMLSHRNFVYQLDAVPASVPIGDDDVLFSVLPVWHSYERIIEYVALSRGAAVAFSQPIREVMLADLVATNPTYFPSVPRIWEGVRAGVFRNVEAEGGIKVALFKFFVAVGSAHAKLQQRLLGRSPRFARSSRVLDVLVSLLPLILLTLPRALGSVLVFSKIRARIGTRFKAGISGAGALPGYVDEFFAAAGILVLEGYGLTESAPVVSVRLERHPVTGTVGPPLIGTEVQVVDEAGNAVPPGTLGVLLVRGPQVMQGYYKREADTKAAISEDGWLNTGDLAMLTVNGEIKITGRVKDTIVLLGGENIEPEPIEDLLRQSVYIEQVMVVGQDQRLLGALVVPDLDNIRSFAGEHGLAGDDLPALVVHDQVRRLIQQEIQARVNQKTGFKSYERISRLALIAKPFEPGEELTHTLKMRRHVIADRYAAEIHGLFS